MYDRYANAIGRISMVALLPLAVMQSLAGSACGHDGNPAATGGYDLRYIPQNTLMVFAARTAEMARVERLQPLRPLADIFLQEFGVKTELKPEDCDQVSMVVVMGGPFSVEPVIVFQCNRDLKPVALPKPRPNAQRSYRMVEYTANARTLIVGRERAIRAFDQMIKEPPDPPPWAGELKQAAGSHFLWVTNTQMFAQLMGGQMRRGIDFPLYAIEPFWRDATTAVFHARAGERITGRITAVCNDAEGARRVEKTTDAVAVLLENLLAGAGRGMPAPRDAAEIVRTGVAFGEELLQSRKFTTDGKRVTATLSVDPKLADEFVAAMMPILEEEQRRMARYRRTQDLRQIVLALHNYHDTHRKFPAAVLTAKDGKTKYSWRVAILPFLDEQALFEQYKFDEPWNSKANLAVMRQMPDVFRHPSDTPDSYKSAYYAITGKRTGFGEPETAMRIRDFTDGTSNTLLVVEAKQGIPWTKPSDLEFEDEGPLPGLGGFQDTGFYAAYADGSAQLIPKGTDEALLRNLIMRNDGNAVQRPRPQ